MKKIKKLAEEPQKMKKIRNYIKVKRRFACDLTLGENEAQFERVFIPENEVEHVKMDQK